MPFLCEPPMPIRQNKSRQPKKGPGKTTRQTTSRKANPTGNRPPGKPQQQQQPQRRRRPSATANPNPQPGERLQKVLAAAGVASRRECEVLITEGRVEVDGEVVTELGTRVERGSQNIRVDGEALTKPKLVYLAVHKPAGVVSTTRDPAGRPRVIDLLPPNMPRLFNVGRLDMASEGLILVTNDGELANQLTHPRHGVEKIYHVQVAGKLDAEVLKQLRQGMYLAEGFAKVKHVKIKGHRKNSTILEMVLDEGRNREIRRLLAKVGHKVQHLIRVAIGPVRLGEMPAGAVRHLERREVAALKSTASGGNTQPGRRPK